MWAKLLKYFPSHFYVILRNMQRSHCKDLIKTLADELLELSFGQHAAARRVLLVGFLTLSEPSLWRRR